MLLKNAKNRQTFSVKSPLKLMLFIGEKENAENYRMVDNLNNLNIIINKKPHQNLIITTKIILNMDHDTVFPSAVTLGLMKQTLKIAN